MLSVKYYITLPHSTVYLVSLANQIIILQAGPQGRISTSTLLYLHTPVMKLISSFRRQIQSISPDVRLLSVPSWNGFWSSLTNWTNRQCWNFGAIYQNIGGNEAEESNLSCPHLGLYCLPCTAFVLFCPVKHWPNLNTASLAPSTLLLSQLSLYFETRQMYSLD